ncbi:IS607 family transposase [Caldivirga sp.]|uniref:IS607 family transposase n=1 Tax=Caldivirga sp. TaxID=2080243 RepID=UPI0025B93991|nr:IS607 family transposase [Caldivirga sp.]
MGERYLSTGEFARVMGVSRSAVIKWIRVGRVVAYNVNGRWRIPYSEVERLIRGVQRIKRVALYARVSSNTQRGDLEKQVESLRLWVVKNLPQAEYVIVTDIASGLKEDRKGLFKLIGMAKRREIDAVVVAYRDRLTRFGFEYLKTLLNALGVEIFVVFQEEPRGYLQELVEDFVDIVTSFAARIYGKRSRKYEEVISCVKDP